jgi:uncharacterized protein with FMN-binding domain
VRRVCAILVLTIAGLIPLWRFHPATPATVVAAPRAATPSQTGAPAASGPPAASGAPAPNTASTVDGSTVDTEFGPYQVQVVFTGTQITDVQIITAPGDRHSQRIASAAEPTLREEALSAQNANVDTVSGATVTSEAYAQSLQAAIDAHGH